MCVLGRLRRRGALALPRRLQLQRGAPRLPAGARRRAFDGGPLIDHPRLEPLDAGGGAALVERQVVPEHGMNGGQAVAGDGLDLRDGAAGERQARDQSMSSSGSSARGHSTIMVASSMRMRRRCVQVTKWLW